MSNSQEKKNLVFIAAVVIGNKVKKDEIESHRRHKNNCTYGGKNWYFEGFLKKSPRWCILGLGTDYNLKCKCKNNLAENKC